MRSSPVVCLIVTLSLAAVAGCSSSSDDGGTAGCSVTLSGAVSGTYACSAVSAGYANASGASAIAFTVASPAINVAIGVPGQLSTTAYTNATTGATGGVTLTSGSSIYYAIVNNGTLNGSFTLRLSTVSTLASVSSGTTYTVHGTLTGTLVPSVGNGATVAFSSSF